jgi:hypothetical protein
MESSPAMTESGVGAANASSTGLSLGCCTANQMNSNSACSAPAALSAFST